MLNSLDARKGQDFLEVSHKDQKNNLSPSLIAFWEVTEGSNMDIVSADGHPLGMTFKFKIDVSLNKDYKQFFQQLMLEPLYGDYLITYKEIEPNQTIFISFELNNIHNRI